MRDRSRARRRLRRVLLVTAAACLGVVLRPLTCDASEVLVVGDTALKPVADAVSGIRQTLKTSPRIRAYGEVRGDLESVVGREGARVVIALGKEALTEALRLPSGICVLYGLTVLPPTVTRPNTGGNIMATPVQEYLGLLGKYLPSLRRVSAVGSQDFLRAVGVTGNPQITAEFAGNPFEFVSRIQQLDGTDAVLLLPDANVLTATALEECYLYSFRRRIPLLGISEKHVREGALLALTFDPVTAGKQLGELAGEVLAGADPTRASPMALRKFDLFINADTARKMAIALPPELLKRAKRVYP